MNKLVIIGNGFDLAHGLPTSYRNFIDDFWAKLKENYKTEEYKTIIEINENYLNILGYDKILSYNEFKDYLIDYCKNYDYKFYEDYSRNLSNNDVIFRFKNDFFKRINALNSENWVDIENEYYKMLKLIVKSESLNLSIDSDSFAKEKQKQITKLNEEFDQIKILLEKYLIDNIKDKYEFDERSVSFYDNQIKVIDIIKRFPLEKGESEFALEFSKVDQIDIEKEKKIYLLKGENPSQVMILNFNYTSTINPYLIPAGQMNVKPNFIHGKLNSGEENKINFGFGYEMDEEYKLIENIDNNEFLKNFKSFQYLQNSNYKNLLGFIDSEKFQTHIVGHSCGLSDRTLLNTVFEHDNCRSIKVHYHKNGENDNYTEIIQNISRHFNDKTLMRKKIVNKTLCSEMPQLKLRKKVN